jgi:ABC-type antimicrobial peptide transport system permease subunit
MSVAGSSLIGKALGWPMAIPIQALGLAVVFSIAVGAIFGFLPARRASKLDPIAALREE